MYFPAWYSVNRVCLTPKAQNLLSKICCLPPKRNITKQQTVKFMCMFPESNGRKFWFHSFHLQNSGISKTRMNQRGTPWKRILTFFKYRNEYHKQLQLKKYMKKWVICIVSFFLSKLWSLNCRKLCWPQQEI